VLIAAIAASSAYRVIHLSAISTSSSLYYRNGQLHGLARGMLLSGGITNIDMHVVAKAILAVTDNRLFHSSTTSIYSNI